MMRKEHVRKILHSSLFSTEILPFVLFGNITGSLPIQKNSRGFAVKLWSVLSIWNSITFVSSMYFMAFITKHMVDYFYAAQTFNDKMFAQIFIVIIIPHAMIPLTLWLDCPKIAVHWNNWDEYQISYYQVTKEIVHLNIKREVIRSMVAVMLKASLPCIAMMYLPPYLEFHQTIIPMQSILLQSVLDFFGTLSWKCHFKASDALTENFKKEIKGSSSARKIADYRNLWIQLCQLNTEKNQCAFRVYIFNMILSLWIVTSGLYGTMLNLIEGDFVKLATFICVTLDNTYPFYVLCNYGYCSSKKLMEIKDEIEELSPSKFEFHVWLEIEAFHTSIIIQPPIFTMGGFVTLNRQLCQSFLTTIATYLIVLVQFHLSTFNRN